MFCPNCGTENTDSNRFCMKCGTELRIVGKSPLGKPRESNNPLSSKSIVAGVIITVVGGLILAFLLINHDAPPHNGAFIKVAPFYYVELLRKTNDQVNNMSLRAQGAPLVSNRRPTIVVWEPRMDLGNLVLDEEVGGLGVQLGYGYYGGKTYVGVSSVTSGSGADRAGIHAEEKRI